MRGRVFLAGERVLKRGGDICAIQHSAEERLNERERESMGERHIPVRGRLPAAGGPFDPTCRGVRMNRPPRRAIHKQRPNCGSHLEVMR